MIRAKHFAAKLESICPQPRVPLKRVRNVELRYKAHIAPIATGAWSFLGMK